MISLMLSEIPNNANVLPFEYLVYAIHDIDGRCCYVGMTRTPQKRISQHLAGLTNLKTILGDGCDLRVDFYTKVDVDALFVAEECSEPLPNFPNNKKWAEAAEWYLCDKFHPYLNVRKGWPGKLAEVRSFATSYGLVEVLGDLAKTTIREWNPPFDHDAILRAFLGGADISGVAKAAGIEFSTGRN